jgi:phage FluMu protein Com
LNIYDTKTIRCAICQKLIGEVDFDAEIIYPKCGQYANPIPDTKYKMPYLIYH